MYRDSMLRARTAMTVRACVAARRARRVTAGRGRLALPCGVLYRELAQALLLADEQTLVPPPGGSVQAAPKL